MRAAAYIQAHACVLLFKHAYRLIQTVIGKAVKITHFQAAFLPGSSGNGAVFKFFRFAEQFFAVAVQVFSGFSQRKAARTAHQKLYPQFFFQRQYLLGYCRLRYKTFFGRFCKAAGVYYGYKIFNLPQQHKPPLLSQELYFLL